ncbi:double zinc ribbon and ankyrin repeat-containing protein 1 isoform X3 [Dromiciops gliroides]|uniref:double zinc ribbon and ankyrin repeat-containing protein 1 isoform X3 n=1 Tax=Dromiciops gliroides TaxID=33562 RepID=UPI001CC4716F|nr:double zinc ribbon and ankyrin repeat-containing protein 1 isoform X3 [Dromiciops gliroides]
MAAAAADVGEREGPPPGTERRLPEPRTWAWDGLGARQLQGSSFSHSFYPSIPAAALLSIINPQNHCCKAVTEKMTAGSVCVPQIIPLRVPRPGKNKHEINTNTLVEMKSDTLGVNIYYTLDGSKPELLKRRGYGENSTFKYTGPITLPDGKIQVKAMAVSRDSRESGIVTKIFQVDYEPPSVTSSQEENDENILKSFEKQELKNEVFTSKLEERDINIENKPGYNAEIKYQENSMETPFCQEEPIFTQSSYQSQFTNSSCMNGQKRLTSAQVLRINRATNFFKCTNCLTTRPCDPFTLFCQECGTPVPPMLGQHHLPPEGAQMEMCLECRTMVPVNTPLCIVCEAPFAPQLQPQANIHLKGKGICQYCGTGNPAPFKHCVTCESRLPEICVPTVPACYSICTKCRASNYPDARYCGSCGDYVEPFTSIKTGNSVIFNAREMDTLSEPQLAWLHAPMSKCNMPAKKDKGTQTVGLFYPSSKFLGKKEMDLVSQKERQEKMNDHRPLLTAISPGRGYWRKQLDHIFAHLRSYALNNPNFRALIGEPRMGKLLSATIHEDAYAVSIRLNYMQITKNIYTNKPVNYDKHFPSTTEGRNGHYGSQFYAVNENNQNTSDSTRDIKNKKKIRPFQGKEDLLSPESRHLLKEISLKGDGRIFVVEQMLDDGADPNCTNNEDRPSLTLAVLNKRHEAIPVLLQKGANIDHQSGPLGNTALHEACLLGPEGKKCIAALLKYDANIQKKNEEGQSAYDLALKMGNDEIISLFQAKLGQEILDEHSQPENLSVDDF